MQTLIDRQDFLDKFDKLTVYIFQKLGAHVLESGNRRKSFVEFYMT